MEFLNKRELAIKENLKNKNVSIEDVEYLLENLTKTKCNLDSVEMELAKEQEKYESLELVLEFQTKAKKKLISENTLLLNDKNYFIEVLKSISRISVSDDKGDPDLDKIKNLADEALEGVYC